MSRLVGLSIAHGLTHVAATPTGLPWGEISSRLFILLVTIFVTTGCDRGPSEAQGRAVVDEERVHLVQLSPDDLQRAGVTVQPAQRTEFRTFRDFPGIVRPNENALAEITTLVRGRVMAVHVDLGRMVEHGQLLAMLYSSDLGLAQSGYLKARARRHVAEHAYERAKYLLKEKVIGQAEAQRREGEMISIRAEANEAKDRLRLLGMSESELETLERTQQIHSEVPLFAPFAGRVIGRNITIGEVVETTQKLFVIADLSTVWVVGNVAEKDIPYVQSAASIPNQLVEVRLAAYPDDMVEGSINYVGDVLDPITRTMQLRLTLPNPLGRFKPEMFASIRVSSQATAAALTIPESAVQHDQEKTFVFVQSDDAAFEPRSIRVGNSNGTLVEVLDGLQEGEPVVTNGAFILKAELLKPDA